MTASGKRFSVGFRWVSIYKLNAHNTPLATSGTAGCPAYIGSRYSGAKAMTINAPQPREIAHVGDDLVELIDFLPPNTALTAELHVGMMDANIASILGGYNAVTLGNAQYIPIMTDKQGFEPYVAVLAYRQANDYPVGTRNWDWYLFPYTRAIFLPEGLAETPTDILFRLAPQRVSTQLWGEAMTALAQGALSEQGIRGQSVGRPMISSFLGNGSVTAFNFDTSYPTIDVTSIVLYKNGTLLSPTTSSLTGITVSPAPGVTDRLDCFYEY